MSWHISDISPLRDDSLQTLFPSTSPPCLDITSYTTSARRRRHRSSVRLLRHLGAAKMPLLRRPMCASGALPQLCTRWCLRGCAPASHLMSVVALRWCLHSLCSVVPFPSTTFVSLTSPLMKTASRHTSTAAKESLSGGRSSYRTLPPRSGGWRILFLSSVDGIAYGRRANGFSTRPLLDQMSASLSLLLSRAR